MATLNDHFLLGLNDHHIEYESELYCRNNWIYYVNSNEIPGELSRENLISSHVKITCYLEFTCENITFAMAT